MHFPFSPTWYWLTLLRSRIGVVDCLAQLLLYSVCWLHDFEGQGCRLPTCCKSSYVYSLLPFLINQSTRIGREFDTLPRMI